MRPLFTITASLALSLPLIILGATAHAAVPTCAGEKATIVGNERSNDLRGTPQRDVIWAGDGNDNISGLGGNDLLYGMAGDDQLFGQDGDDVITPDGHGSAGADLVDGGAGNDKITSLAGYDTLLGGYGVDEISSSSLNRLAIKGGPGTDTVTVPVPSEPGFNIVGNDGQDKLRMVTYANPAVFPTVRIDQRKGLTTITQLQPVAVTGKFQSFTEVSLPANTKTIYLQGDDEG